MKRTSLPTEWRWVWGKLNERLHRLYILPIRPHSDGDARRMLLLTRASALGTNTTPISLSTARRNTYRIIQFSRIYTEMGTECNDSTLPSNRTTVSRGGSGKLASFNRGLHKN